MESATADDIMMERALDLARQAAAAGEVPVGAVLADASSNILQQAHNLVEGSTDATAHAELLVIREAMRAGVNKRLPPGCTLYVTLEPCAMCAGAISLARVSRLVFAAGDPKGGGVVHGGRFYEQPTCHHRPTVEQDHAHAETSAALLRGFFAARRKPTAENEAS